MIHISVLHVPFVSAIIGSNTFGCIVLVAKEAVVDFPGVTLLLHWWIGWFGILKAASLLPSCPVPSAGGLWDQQGACHGSKSPVEPTRSRSNTCGNYAAGNDDGRADPVHNSRHIQPTQCSDTPNFNCGYFLKKIKNAAGPGRNLCINPRTGARGHA